jgi:hypothetical protein
LEAQIVATNSDDALSPTTKEPQGSSQSAKPNLIEIPATLSVRQLAELLEVSAIDIIKQLMRNGIMANINQPIDYEAAAPVAASLGYETRPKPQAARKLSSAIIEFKKGRHLQGEASWGTLITVRPDFWTPFVRPMSWPPKSGV